MTPDDLLMGHTCMMLPLSNRLMGFPSVKVSERAGIRPFGLMAKNHGSF